MKELVWNIVKRFLVMIPIVALFLVLYGQLVALEQRNAREKIISEHIGHLSLMEYMIDTVFNEYYSTLHLVRNSNEMSYYLADPTLANQAEVVSFFQRISENRPYINGLLFGSANGEPLYGLTSFNGSFELFNEDAPYIDIWHELAGKAGKLAPGEIQFSAYATVPDHLDNSRLVHRVGLAIPVHQDGELTAIIGMLVDGNHILSVLRQFLVSHPREINYSLVDDSGNRIFRFEDGVLGYFLPGSVSLREEQPRLWASIVDKDVGSLTLGRMNYHFISFDPLQDVSLFYEEHPHFLVGLMSFNDDHIIVLEDSFLLRNKPLRWVMSLAILILGGFINLLAYFRRSDRELLAVSNLVSDQSHDGVVITDTLEHVSYCNRTFELLSGFSNDEIRSGRHEVRTLSGDRFDAAKAIHELKAKDPSVSSWKGFVWVEGKHHVALTHLSVSTVSSHHGHIAHHVGLYSNPRNLSRESYDHLLVDREVDADGFDIFPVHLLEQKRGEGRQFVLVYLKLMNLDLIEARYSLDEHYLLGARIRDRISHVLDHEDLIIQYSPDTFLLTRHIANSRLMRELEGLERMFTKPFGLREQQQIVHAKMGISGLSSYCADAATMLRQGRMALAALDHFGQEGMLRYDKSVDEHLIRYHAILQAFPDAIAQQKPQVFYQPVVDVLTNRIIAAEALIRWTHPTLGPLSPAEFIPIVEQNNLERMLGKYVVEEVSGFLRQLDTIDRGISISMNLCPTELQDPDLVGYMVRVLDSKDISHERLIIELTERTLLTDMKAANSVLDKLHLEHIRVAIDDFGTGFSSLSYLNELNVDVLKIDRSFIKDYPDQDDGVILKAMVGMARELGIPVLVEGIETTEQLQLLKQLGVSSYQGFLFSKAIDADAFIKMLQ